jgi:hypothetical protein
MAVSGKFQNHFPSKGTGSGFKRKQKSKAQEKILPIDTLLTAFSALASRFEFSKCPIV